MKRYSVNKERDFAVLKNIYKSLFVVNHYKDGLFIDYGYKLNKENLVYRKIKGFAHIFSYCRNSENSYLCSFYKHENGDRWVTILATFNGWRVHLMNWINGKMIDTFKYYKFLNDCIEDSEMFINGKIDIC